MRKIALLAVLAAASVGVACGDDGSGGSGATGGDASGGSGGDATGGNATGGHASGGNASGGAGGAESSFAAYCDARSTLCQGDAAECKAEETCALAFLRDEIESSLFACLASSCEEEMCLSQASQNPSPVAAAARTRCLAKRTECQGSDDICLSLPVLNDTLIAQFDACIDLADCNAVNTCLSDQSDVIDACDSWL